MIYIGEYPVPPKAVPPLISRISHLSLYTAEHYWTLHDELEGLTVDGVEHSYWVKDEKGKTKIFTNLTTEILHYPLYRDEDPQDLLNHFESDWSPDKFNDQTIEEMLERYYKEKPYMRPTDLSYDEVKYPLPTELWRKAIESTENNNEYFTFCNKVEKLLSQFITELDANSKAAQKPLLAFNKQLNKLQEEIGSMEAEDLFIYLARILQSIKKPRLIETLEQIKEW